MSLALVAWRINSAGFAPWTWTDTVALSPWLPTSQPREQRVGYTYIRSHHGFAGTKQTRHTATATTTRTTTTITDGDGVPLRPSGSPCSPRRSGGDRASERTRKKPS